MSKPFSCGLIVKNGYFPTIFYLTVIWQIVPVGGFARLLRDAASVPARFCSRVAGFAIFKPLHQERGMITGDFAGSHTPFRSRPTKRNGFLVLKGEIGKTVLRAARPSYGQASRERGFVRSFHRSNPSQSWRCSGCMCGRPECPAPCPARP